MWNYGSWSWSKSIDEKYRWTRECSAIFQELVWTCQCECGVNFMQCPMQSKAGSPNTRNQLFKVQQEDRSLTPVLRCVQKYNHHQVEGWGKSRQRKRRGGERSRYTQVKIYTNQWGGLWGAGSILRRMKCRQHGVKPWETQSDIIDAQWKGKKKNSFVQNKSSLPCFVCLQSFGFGSRSEWKVGQGGQALSGLGAVGEGSRVRRNGPERRCSNWRWTGPLQSKNTTYEGERACN